MTSLLYIIQTTSLSKINKNILKNIEKQLKKLIHIAVATKMITERSPKNILDSGHKAFLLRFASNVPLRQIHSETSVSIIREYRISGYSPSWLPNCSPASLSRPVRIRFTPAPASIRTSSVSSSSRQTSLAV